MQGNDDVYMCVQDGDRVSVSAASFRGRTHPENQTQVKHILGLLCVGNVIYFNVLYMFLLKAFKHIFIKLYFKSYIESVL